MHVAISPTLNPDLAIPVNDTLGSAGRFVEVVGVGVGVGVGEAEAPVTD